MLCTHNLYATQHYNSNCSSFSLGPINGLRQLQTESVLLSLSIRCSLLKRESKYWHENCNLNWWNRTLHIITWAIINGSSFGDRNCWLLPYKIARYYYFFPVVVLFNVGLHLGMSFWVRHQCSKSFQRPEIDLTPFRAQTCDRNATQLNIIS
jgi:hypothetical protein